VDSKKLPVDVIERLNSRRSTFEHIQRPPKDDNGRRGVDERDISGFCAVWIDVSRRPIIFQYSNGAPNVYRWRRMRRACHEGLNVRASEKYKPVQTRDAISLALNMLDKPEGYENHIEEYVIMIIPVLKSSLHSDILLRCVCMIERRQAVYSALCTAGSSSARTNDL